MINISQYPDIKNDLSYQVDDLNNMNLIINFSKVVGEFFNIVNEKGAVSIPFQMDTKYDKMVSIFLTTEGRFVIDEAFNDEFYIPSTVPRSIDRICWFTIPANYNNSRGLNGLEIYCKGGCLSDDDTTAN